MSPIIEPAIRPPAEAFSFLLQVTLGCSANSCTFCGAYNGKPFKMKDSREIEKDILEGSKYYPDTRKVFLMDGDALVLNNSKLMPILRVLPKAFPKLTRISSYANADNITRRSKDELIELYNHKVRLIYMGLESGSQKVLDMCEKKASADNMIKAVQIADQARIKTSLIVLLGLGGKEMSKEHVKETIKAINKMQPRYLSFLSLMLIPGTKLYDQAKAGVFQELDSKELLQEAQGILAGLELDKTIFRCNHASNYLPLEGRLPQDKDRLLGEIKAGLDGDVSLRAEFLRGL